jgi:hypothetical protein
MNGNLGEKGNYVKADQNVITVTFGVLNKLDKMVRVLDEGFRIVSKRGK